MTEGRISRRLDDTFKISVALKGIDGALEVIGGVLLLVVGSASLSHLARALTQHELSKDPHDFIARHILRSAAHLEHGTKLFAAVYLLSHGIAKVVLVAALLRERLWAYPGMIGLLGAFIVYQCYRIAFRPSIGLVLLTIFDAVVVWLTWREWQARRRSTPAQPSP